MASVLFNFPLVSTYLALQLFNFKKLFFFPLSTTFSDNIPRNAPYLKISWYFPQKIKSQQWDLITLISSLPRWRLDQVFQSTWPGRVLGQVKLLGFELWSSENIKDSITCLVFFFFFDNVHTSCLLTNNSKRSVKPDFDRCHLANGLIISGWLIIKVGFTHVSSKKCPTSCKTVITRKCSNYVTQKQKE